jgi:molybdate transport repressor ModE-like protein
MKMISCAYLATSCEPDRECAGRGNVLQPGLSAITLRQLGVFAAVARERSFARAADALMLSQPAVSDLIKQLEQAVGVKLLDRSPGRKEVRVTEPGLVLLRGYDEMAQTLTRTLHAVDTLRGPQGGLVSFGAGPCFGGFVLPRVHKTFRQRFPSITVRVGVDWNRSILESLRARTIDLAVITGRADRPGIVHEPLGGFDVLLVGLPGHRLATGVAPFSALAGERLILPNDMVPIRTAIDGLAAQAGIELQIGLEVNTMDTRIQAVMDGLGIAALGDYSVVSRVAAGQLAQLHVEGFPVRSSWHIVHREDELSVAAQAFKDHLIRYREVLEKSAFAGLRKTRRRR